MELFLHNILISLGREEKETVAPRRSLEWWVGGTGGSLGPLRWLILDVPSGTAAVFPLPSQPCKGQIAKQGRAGSEHCSVFTQPPKRSWRSVVQILRGATPVPDAHRPSTEQSMTSQCLGCPPGMDPGGNRRVTGDVWG